MSAPPSTPRACGECDACCTIGGVPSLGKPAYTPCPRSTCAGCAIYAARPRECREYRCLWLDDAIGDDADRPDLLGLVFDLPTLVEEHPDYAGVRVICARETRRGARDGPRAADLLTRLARRMVVRLTAVDGRTQLMGPRDAVGLLARRAAERAGGG